MGDPLPTRAVTVLRIVRYKDDPECSTMQCNSFPMMVHRVIQSKIKASNKGSYLEPNGGGHSSAIHSLPRTHKAPSYGSIGLP